MADRQSGAGRSTSTGSDHVSGATEPGAAQDNSAATSVPPEKQVFMCDLCGAQMLNLHCKLICNQCGYKRDCSDP